MIEELIPWAAGLFEGEGSFSYSKLPHRKDSYKIAASICSTDKDVIERFFLTVGFGTIKGPYKSSYPTGKVRYTWEVQNKNDCCRIINLLYPFLLSRLKVQADNLLKVIHRND